MSILCLGTYLKIVKQCKCKSCTQKKFVGNIMHCLSDEFDETDDVGISKLVGGVNNPSNEVREMAQDITADRYCEIVDYFSNNVIPLLDPNQYELIRSAICDVVMKDEDIKDGTVVELVSGTTKDNLEMKDTNLTSFLAGIFLYVMKFTDNNNRQEDVKGLNKDYFEEISKKIADKSPKKPAKVQDEEVYLAAQKFCIEHEEEKELLPLCQIAFFVDPHHKNIRNLYTDYNICSDSVKKRILELKGVTELDFTDKNWIDRCVSLYEKKITEMELTTRNFLYDGAKYLHRAYERYSACEIDDFELYIFDKIEKTETLGKPIGGIKKTDLRGYIADYLGYKKNRSEQTINPPMDELWDVCNLGDCSESDVTFWICQFIIDSCYYIDNKGIQTNDESDFRNIGIGDSECLIKTQEDIYYYALLQLYKCFYYRYD